MHLFGLPNGYGRIAFEEISEKTVAGKPILAEGRLSAILTQFIYRV
jgi:hypothetical protein